jgi:hypothetical protein
VSIVVVTVVVVTFVVVVHIMVTVFGTGWEQQKPRIMTDQSRSKIIVAIVMIPTAVIVVVVVVVIGGCRHTTVNLIIIRVMVANDITIGLNPHPWGREIINGRFSHWIKAIRFVVGKIVLFHQVIVMVGVVVVVVVVACIFLVIDRHWRRQSH